MDSENAAPETLRGVRRSARAIVPEQILRPLPQTHTAGVVPEVRAQDRRAPALPEASQRRSAQGGAHQAQKKTRTVMSKSSSYARRVLNQTDEPLNVNPFEKQTSSDPFDVLAQCGLHRTPITHWRKTKPHARRRRIVAWVWREWLERVVWLKTRGKCFYCKRPLTLWFGEFAMVKDHYIPFSLGGADDHSNLVPACRDCDRRKGARMPHNFHPERSTAARAWAGAAVKYHGEFARTI